MNRRLFLLGVVTPAAACTAKETNGIGQTRGPSALTNLPRPVTEAGMTLAAALAARRSVRDFAATAVTPAELAQLLWAAQGVSSDRGGRTAPSAGALYPLTVYAALPSGLYRYTAEGSRVAQVLTDDLRARLAKAALGQDWLAAASVVLVITADVGRTAQRYGARAERYVQLEAGHAAQNLLLQATALGLGATPVGAFDDDQVGRVLQLPARERPLYLVPVGRPR
jgi:SagB-type dehydrogenase family enzyme